VNGTDLDRRRFLALAGAAALAPSAVAAALAAPRRRLLQRNGYAIDAETPLDLLTDYLTPNDLFFIRSHWNPTTVDSRSWRLVVDGEVASPLSLDLGELKAMPRSTGACVLQCAGNGRGLFSPTIPGVQWRFGAVGNARWTGVSVQDLLEKAGVKSSARHIHTFGADVPPGKVPPFHRSVEIEKLLQDGVVAFEMNGRPLPETHGGPARLIVPGWAGDHWMKWLTRITAAPTAQTGFYMDTAYRYPIRPGAPGVPVKPEDTKYLTELAVKSNITGVPARARVGHATRISGFAFSGSPDISRVEVSDDRGTTWQDATLAPDHDPYAWRLWSYLWTPVSPGRSVLMVRATDSSGAVQPKDGVWNPSGYLFNGWHSVEVEVAR
jgi:sulfite oxidase